MGVEEKRSLSKFFGVLSKLSLSSSHQVFLNWNRSLSLKRKPSLSELSPHFRASLSAHQVFLSEENHQSLSMSLSLKKKVFLSEENHKSLSMSLSLKKPSLSV